MHECNTHARAHLPQRCDEVLQNVRSKAFEILHDDHYRGSVDWPDRSEVRRAHHPVSALPSGEVDSASNFSLFLHISIIIIWSYILYYHTVWGCGPAE